MRHSGGASTSTHRNRERDISANVPSIATPHGVGRRRRRESQRCSAPTRLPPIRRCRCGGHVSSTIRAKSHRREEMRSGGRSVNHLPTSLSGRSYRDPPDPSVAPRTARTTNRLYRSRQEEPANSGMQSSRTIAISSGRSAASLATRHASSVRPLARSIRRRSECTRGDARNSADMPPPRLRVGKVRRYAAMLRHRASRRRLRSRVLGRETLAGPKCTRGSRDQGRQRGSASPTRRRILWRVGAERRQTTWRALLY